MRRRRPDLVHFDRLPGVGEHLDAVEAHVVPVAPGAPDVDGEVLAARQLRDEEVLLLTRRLRALVHLRQHGQLRAGEPAPGRKAV